MVVEARGRERRRRKKTLASISIFFSLLSKKKKKNSNNKPTPTTKLLQVADPFRRRETRPKHMWATSGSRKVAADGWGENNNADETAAAASAAAEAADAAAAAAAAAEEESIKLSPSKAAARASKLLEPTFQRPIPALEIDVSGIEAELAEARRVAAAGGPAAAAASGGLSEISRTLLGADWRPTPLPGAAALRRISLEEYKRRQGLA